MREVLRLCRKQIALQNKCFYQVRSSTSIVTKKNENKNSNNKDLTVLLEEYRDKIKFNSYLEHEKLELGYFKYHIKTQKKAKSVLQKEYKEKSLPPLPVSLRYYVDEERLLKEDNEDNIEEPNNEFQLPFGTTTQIKYDTSEPVQKTHNKPSADSEEFDRSNIDKWMTNYEHFDDSKIASNIESDDESEGGWSKYYGTPDPTVGVSRVRCGGCGALLHCSDPAIPGYLPSEIFKNRAVDELRTTECQRCHFLKEYNIALDVSVEPEEYEKLLQSIRYSYLYIIFWSEQNLNILLQNK